MSGRTAVLGDAELVVWWVALIGLWLLTLSTVSVPELVAAVVLALPCAIAARAARHATAGSWTPKASWVRWFTHIPVVGETGTALRAGKGKGLDSVVLPDEPPSTSDARKALATVAIGLSPGSMVVDTPADDHVLIVHRLVGGRSPALDKVRR